MVTVKDRRIAGASTSESEWLAWTGVTDVPAVTATELVPPGARAVILAPHPDDEILMVGGLLQQLHQIKRDYLLIAATDGEGSHPGSSQWSIERLRTVRPTESQQALDQLAIDPPSIHRLHFPDGGVSEHGTAFCRALVALLRPNDVIFTTWSLDGHSDHDRCGVVALEAAAITSATVVEVPVWTWHWAVPDDPRVPWHRLRQLLLTPTEHTRKLQAVGAFFSQLHADPTTGRHAVLPDSLHQRLARHHEYFFV
jgi:LmbE family N-acetylglucosaminyl deacetylase